jgi:hypothetical protein
MNIFSDTFNDKFSEETKGFCQGQYAAMTNLKKNGSVYIIPECEVFRLLYTVHSGYTWLDVDANKGVLNPIYPNAADNSTDNYKAVRNTICQVLDDTGCFVFETLSPISIPFRSILFDFVQPLTEMKFCGFFSTNCLYTVTYHNDIKAIVFEFDTESG